MDVDIEVLPLFPMLPVAALAAPVAVAYAGTLRRRGEGPHGVRLALALAGASGGLVAATLLTFAVAAPFGAAAARAGHEREIVATA